MPEKVSFLEGNSCFFSYKLRDSVSKWKYKTLWCTLFTTTTPIL